MAVKRMRQAFVLSQMLAKYLRQPFVYSQMPAKHQRQPFVDTQMRILPIIRETGNSIKVAASTPD